MSNTSFIVTFSAMMLTILILSGCAGRMVAQTGHFTCLGFCQLTVDHREGETETTTGLAGFNHNEEEDQ